MKFNFSVVAPPGVEELKPPGEETVPVPAEPEKVATPKVILHAVAYLLNNCLLGKLFVFMMITVFVLLKFAYILTKAIFNSFKKIFMMLVV